MNDTAISLREKSFALALKVVQLVQGLEERTKNWVLPRQLLKSGTSIGANIREARFAQSKADFVSKLSIALKEGEETLYWLELLNRSGQIGDDEFNSLASDTNWLIGTLVNTIKTAKANMGHQP